MLFDRIRSRRERERLLRFMLSQYPIRATKVRTTPDFFEVYTDQGVMALHWHSGKPEELWLAYIVFEQLQSSSVMNVVHWYETVHNQPYLRVEGETFYLTSWFEDGSTTAQGISLDRAAETLAKLHTVSREVILAQDFADALPDPVPVPTDWYERLAGLEQYLQDLGNLDYRSSFEEQLLEFGHKVLQRGQQALRLLGQVEYPSDVRDGLALEYSGYSLSNLRRVEDRVYYIPKHPSYRWGWRIVDLAAFILSTCTEADTVKSLLDHYFAIARLKDWELLALPAAILFPYQEVDFIMQYRDTGSENSRQVELLSQQLEKSEELSSRLTDLVDALVDRANNIIVVNPADIRLDVGEGANVEEYKNGQKPEEAVEELEEDDNSLAEGQEDISTEEETRLHERNRSDNENCDKVKESAAEGQEAEEHGNEGESLAAEPSTAGEQQQDSTLEELEYEGSIQENSGEQEEEPSEQQEQDESGPKEDQPVEKDELSELQAKAEKYKQQYKKLITWGPFPEPIHKKDQPQ